MRSTTSTARVVRVRVSIGTCDPQTTADVFQDTWLDAISHIGQFDPKQENSGHGCSESPGGGLPSTGGSGWRVATRSRPTVTKSSLRHWTAQSYRTTFLRIWNKRPSCKPLCWHCRPSGDRCWSKNTSRNFLSPRSRPETGKSPKAVESLLCRAREQFRALLGWYFADTKCGTDT